MEDATHSQPMGNHDEDNVEDRAEVIRCKQLPVSKTVLFGQAHLIKQQTSADALYKAIQKAVTAVASAQGKKPKV